MALEKITIATEEKQDKILQDINEIKNLNLEMFAKSFLQIKTGDSTKESNCKYLLIGVTTRDGGRIFDSLKAIDTSGSSLNRYDFQKYITDKTTKIGNTTFYLLKEALIVTEYDMYGSESALMLKLE